MTQSLQAVLPPSAQTLTEGPKVSKPSRWIWVPWIWFFFASTRSLSTWMSGTDRRDLAAMNGSGSPVDRVLMTALMLLGAFVLSRRWERAMRLFERNKWMVALFVFMTLSIVWSNFPGISFRRLNRSIGAFEMALIVLTESYPLEAVRILLSRLYIVHIPLSVLAVKYFRNIGVAYNWNGAEEQWIGLATDKNSLGQVATCAGVFFVWQILQDWPARKLKRNRSNLALYIVLLAGDLWLLRGSPTIHSSTAIIGFILCAGALFALQLIKKRHKHAKRIIVGVVLTSAIAVPITYLVCQIIDFSPFQAAVGATGRDMTSTDRTLIWTDMLNDTKASALFGVGVGAFWVGPIGYDKYPMPNWSARTPAWRPEEGHNGYIDVYAELGVSGLLLILLVIVAGLAGAISEIQNNFLYGSLRLTLLFSIIINNITETSFLRGEHGLWFLFLLMAINVPSAMTRPLTAMDEAKRHYSLDPLKEKFKRSPGPTSPASSAVAINR